MRIGAKLSFLVLCVVCLCLARFSLDVHNVWLDEREREAARDVSDVVCACFKRRRVVGRSEELLSYSTLLFHPDVDGGDNGFQGVSVSQGRGSGIYSASGFVVHAPRCPV